MPKIEKMFEKVVRSPNNTNWRELVTLIEYYGCKVKQGSKHVLVYHDLRPRPITVSVHNGKVKTVYVKEIIKLIKEIQEEDQL